MLNTPSSMTWDARFGVEPIILGHMPQQARLAVSEDDWTGLSNQKERRKRQNRLNQRAYRSRVRLDSVQPSYCMSRPTQCSVEKAESLSSSAAPRVTRDDMLYDNGPWPSFYSAVCSSKLDVTKLTQTAVICKKLSSGDAEMMVAQFQRWIEQERYLGSPNADHLLMLVKFNVFRALISNSLMLGFPTEGVMEEDAVSPFAPPARPNHQELKIPLTLRSTSLQTRTLHHPWIDLIPIPKMRDNLLLAGDTYDDLDLCGDLVGFFNSPTARTGMIIWGNPWDPTGWEVTPQFLQRWGWTIRGCWELFDSTNYWRSQRGEEPLNFGTLECEELGWMPS